MQGLGPGSAGLLSPTLCAQGVKARNLIHARIEENIRAKICRLRAGETGGICKDALQLLIEHSWDRGERLDMQVSGGLKQKRSWLAPCFSWGPASQ